MQQLVKPSMQQATCPTSILLEKGAHIPNQPSTKQIQLKTSESQRHVPSENACKSVLAEKQMRVKSAEINIGLLEHHPGLSRE